MTIKNRLFLSNILMIIILLAAIITNMMIDRLGVYNLSNKNTALFYQTLTFIIDSNDKWSAENDPKQIINDIEQLGHLDKGNALSLAIYDGTANLSAIGEFEENALFRMAKINPEEKLFSMGNTILYCTPIGNYQIYLLNEDYVYGENERIEDIGNSFPYSYLVIVLIVLIASRLLNKMVFKSIILPLTMLVDGVHEIRDGNLDYRIEYAEKDEFSFICADFNEMASQTQKLMDEKQKDEGSRKELIAGIAHDLRTPLTSIKAYIEGLQKGVATTVGMQEEYLQTISDKADDLQYIIEQLFLFSKMDAGELPLFLAKTDIGQFLAQYEESVSEEYSERGLKINLEKNVADVIVETDCVQLRNVFTNLLENTLKYARKENGIVTINCIETYTGVEISFQDNGEGISDDKLDKIFNAFYRADHSTRKRLRRIKTPKA